MINRRKLVGGTLLFYLMAISITAETSKAQNAAPPAKNKTTPPEQTPAPPSRPVLEPKAIELLKASCARLATAHSMSFTAEVTYESPSRAGFPCCRESVFHRCPGRFDRRQQ